ncbi:hypothetical protein BSL78_12040 [Apostichopus japonicus]|uniref:Uncharacterized protein n=1 Tax=Stichopus japonicus TaxID=307972 RepID=A0A2G8KT29_STIJA|nr:hypothetical protein BSL78_12040 [Apostichopus japonicus]
MDFAKYPGYKPDIMTRRAAMLRGEGLNNKLLFSHHKSDHTENLVSWYDQHYNKKERPVSDQLPEFRHWDGNRLAWEPEASDHPIRGQPTNFGLRESMKKKWEKEEAQAGLGDYNTTYGTSFKDLPANSLVTTHYSPPKALSTRMHPANQINKDLSLRTVNVIQTPEQVIIPTGSRLASKEGSKSAIPDVSI